jgi:hypothetical protein
MQFRLSDYLPIILMFIVAVAFAAGSVLLSQFVGQRKRTKTKLMPYECGKDPVGSARERFSVTPYLPALDPGSPAQASLSTEQLPLARSPIDLPDCAARGFAGPSIFPARRLEPRSLEAKTVQCSAALLGSTTPASRFAHLPHEEVGSRVALEKIDSSGASSRLAR